MRSEAQHSSAKLSHHQNVNSQSNWSPVSYRADSEGAASVVCGLGLRGPDRAHSLHKYHLSTTVFQEWYEVLAWNECRKSFKLSELTIGWKTGTEANDLHTT